MTATVSHNRAEMALPWTHVDDHFIDGTWRASSGPARTEVVDPATEEIWGSVTNATAEDIDAAMVAADSAFRKGSWPRLRPSARAEYLRRIADQVERRAQPMA
jgi:aldehyde dehydrogenase (NAD+)